MKLWHKATYLAFLVREVLLGSWQVAVAAIHPRTISTPAIVEMPLRCASDLEITILASSITITPGTLVLGTAAADGDSPPTLFVHAMFAKSRQEALDGLYDMETRLLRASRGTAKELPAIPPHPSVRGEESP
ncbi:hypothetical protein KEM60_03127 [Austwickia sp. TVS 96-490-7B]|uniref:Na+/H+ antiporter subunit E n=1 Tax=Austwickia sp. TVS 96-490-7B TaxID=2830843 RepID=UPI001C590A81|nr:Na+/H+ antiporter subunit E [Austwickia sp. TVS 96-490-7B]MBW3086898.1 hypothetical protein [Austwickia sp. TVS 96-490-7B]